MEKRWLDSYPSQVPAEIDASRYHSLPDMFVSCCDFYKNSNAMYCLGRHWTYQELHKHARDFAAYLRHGLQLEKGSRLAIMMPNLPQYPVALHGALMAGLVVVNVNPMYTAYELSHQLQDSQADALLVLANFTDTVEDAVKSYNIRHIMVTEAGDMLGALKRTAAHFILRYIKREVPRTRLEGVITYRKALNEGAKLELDKPELNHDDIAFLQYTGGTTGLPKGAILTHGNILANVLQVAAWVDHWLEAGSETVITALPLYHIFSLTVCGLAFVLLGFCSVLIPNPKDFRRFIKELKEHPFTLFIGVNTLFNALMDRPEFQNVDFSKLKFTIGGGMAVHPETSKRWKQLTGSGIIEGYGLTEASPVVSINRLDGNVEHSIGLPIPSTDITICDDEDNELDFGEKGELCIKGPQVMRGYWQQPEETADTFTSQGYLKSGDMAYLDESGYIYLVDRKKDMIVISGFNVYPAEIEQVLCSHSSVAEAAVIGVESQYSGETVKAFVVAADDQISSEELRSYCRQYLTRYKVPKHIEFREELPKSNVGKILRRELKDE